MPPAILDITVAIYCVRRFVVKKGPMASTQKSPSYWIWTGSPLPPYLHQCDVRTPGCRRRQNWKLPRQHRIDTYITIDTFCADDMMFVLQNQPSLRNMFRLLQTCVVHVVLIQSAGMTFFWECYDMLVWVG